MGVGKRVSGVSKFTNFDIRYRRCVSLNLPVYYIFLLSHCTPQRVPSFASDHLFVVGLHSVGDKRTPV